MQVFQVAICTLAPDIGLSLHVEPVQSKPPLYGDTKYFDLFFITLRVQRSRSLSSRERFRCVDLEDLIGGRERVGGAFEVAVCFVQRFTCRGSS